MLSATTAAITHDDAFEAGRDLAAELLDGLGADPDVVLLFAASTYDPGRLLDGLYRRLDPRVQLVGCTSFAEIAGGEALRGSVAALALRTKDLGVHALHAGHGEGDSFTVGRVLARQAWDHDPSALLVFVDGLELDSAAVLAGAHSVLGPDFPIAGAVAADDARFAATHQFCGRAVHRGAAVALALTGPLRLLGAAHSGWEPIGSPRRCTRVERGRLLLELDGQPALQIYRDYLGAHGHDLGSAGVEFPLGLVDPRGRSSGQVRIIHGIDDARGGLLCHRDIPVGAEVRMLRATKDELIHGAALTAGDLRQRLPDARLALVFDGFARKVVLGARHGEEIAAACAHLPVGIPHLGFYGFGEIAPSAGRTLHRDATFTAIVLEA